VSDKTNSVVCGDIVHNHDVDSTLSRQMFSNSVKKGAAENPSEKPSKIICRQLHQDQYKDLTLTPTDMTCVKEICMKNAVLFMQLFQKRKKM
jgi:hypothetical protein